MGKRIVLLLLLALILGGALMQNIYVTNVARDLIDDLEIIKMALEKEDYNNAISLADNFIISWEKEKKTFEALFEHKEIDIISATVNSIQSLCESKEQAHALSEIASVTYYFKHLIEIDSVDWENIF